MITIERRSEFFKPVSITLFESIEDLPVRRFFLFNKYMLLHNGLGSDFFDIDAKHIATLYKLLDDRKKAAQQLLNFRQLIYNILNELNPVHLAFAALVYAINGEPVTDLSEESLKRIIVRISDYGFTDAELKKKLRKSRMASPRNLYECFRSKPSEAQKSAFIQS